MSNPIIKTNVELAGIYGSALEYWLRVNKVFMTATERMVKEHIALVDASVANLAPVAAVKQPKDLIEAQSAMVGKVQEQVTTAAKNIFKIQQETGEELKALVEEGMQKFSPTVVPWIKKAA